MQGPTGAKLAIVEVEGKWRAFYCVESPEVRFEDVLEMEAEGGETSCPIDPMFVRVCVSGSIVAVAALSESDNSLYAKVSGSDVVFSRPLDDGETVRVTLSGVRIGFAGVRFERKTKAEVEANARKYFGPVFEHGPSA